MSVVNLMQLSASGQGEEAEKAFIKGLLQLEDLLDSKGSALVYCNLGLRFSPVLVAGYMLGKLEFPLSHPTPKERVYIVIVHLNKMRRNLEFESLTGDRNNQMETSSFLERFLPKIDEAFLSLPRVPLPNVFSKEQANDDTLRGMELNEIANLYKLNPSVQWLAARPVLLRGAPKMRAHGGAGSAHGIAEDPVVLNQEMKDMHVQLKETLVMVQGELAGEQSQYTAILDNVGRWQSR